MQAKTAPSDMSRNHLRAKSTQISNITTDGTENVQAFRTTHKEYLHKVNLDYKFFTSCDL